jgi:tRNA(Ile)-lysidine synthase
MLTDLQKQLRSYDMLRPGDTVTCAVSGGADSVALLFGMYLLKDKLGITLQAAHFNHHLRGEESDRDEAFVRQFCDRYDIPLTVGQGNVVAGKKGLEAAARDARYAFLKTLSGKIATAHTADDNAETVLMHLVRGTGLKGLGGIAPVNGSFIRPMLNITRSQVEAFLREYCLTFVEDSSNGHDDFLRNRLRHHVMPLLAAENPRFAENTSAMAQRLRQDEAELAGKATFACLPDVEELKAMTPALRSRILERFLKESGVREPEAEHIALAESLVFSGKPSARAQFPGGITVTRVYGKLQAAEAAEKPRCRITCGPAEEVCNTADTFTVRPVGTIVVRSRQSGDEMRLPGGTKSLKKLFIDRKIPAAQRDSVPVIADERGVLGVYGIGVNLDRVPEQLPATRIRVEIINSSESCKEK